VQGRFGCLGASREVSFLLFKCWLRSFGLLSVPQVPLVKKTAFCYCRTILAELREIEAKEEGRSSMLRIV
jgi:hypothetical protein